MKIYGVGLGGSNVNIAGNAVGNNNSNKYSKQKLNMKLEPIKHNNLNLPKLVGGQGIKDKSPDRMASRLPKIG